MKRTLLRGARVIAVPSREPAPGPLDILVEDSSIAALGPDLHVGDAEVVDAADRIIIPGLVNAHLHCWQTALRCLAYDWTLSQYVAWMHGRLAPLFRPADLHVGTLAAALNQIACGATTVGDWCHNNPTPDHADAAAAALAESGIRAVFLHGTPRPNGARHAPPPHPRAELERLQATTLFAPGGLLTLGMGAPGPLYSSMDVAEADFGLARDLGLMISMHHSGGETPPGAWERLDERRLLGPHVNVVHGNTIDTELLRRLVDLGVTFTVTPEVELGDGHGQPITGRLRALKTAPSLGVDIESAVSGEMLIVARLALAHQRSLDHAAAQREGRAMESIPAREALAWATIEGARALGLADRIGTLEVGKQADLVIIDPRHLNLWPANDIVAASLQASLANIEAVMIGGKWRKQDGRLVCRDMGPLREKLKASAARITAEAELSG